MAIRNPPDLYNGAAVAFNTMPYLNFQLKALAEKKAKEEALDEYYQKLPTTVNTAGVRDQDRYSITQKHLPELRKYYAENKEKIKHPAKDGGIAQLEYEKKFRMMQDIAERSKEEARKGLELGKMRFDPKTSYIFDDEDIMKTIKDWEHPVDDENFKPLDLLTMTTPAVPFEQDKYLKQFENVPMEQLPAEVTRDAKNFTRTITQRSTYGKPGLEAIHNRAATQFASDKSFRSFVKKQLDNPESLKELNGVFKKNYGKDIQTYDDLAAAYTIKSLPEKVTTKTEDDRLAFDLLNDRQQRARDERNNQNAIARLRLNDELVRGRKADGVDEKSDEVWIDDYFENITSDAESKKVVSNYSTSEGAKSQEYEIAADPVIKKALTITVDGKPQEPSVVLWNKETQKFRPVYYKTDENYQPIVKNGKYLVLADQSAPISKQQMKLALGVKSTTGKQRVKEMTNKPQGKKFELD